MDGRRRSIDYPLYPNFNLFNLTDFRGWEANWLSKMGFGLMLSAEKQKFFSGGYKEDLAKSLYYLGTFSNVLK